MGQRLDGGGDVLGTYAFDAYGLRQGTDSSVDSYTFFGGQWGYYDPGTARFVTRDPIRYGGGIDLYGYADNNPINFPDSIGTRPFEAPQFGPDGDRVDPNQLHWHESDTYHEQDHWDYTRPGNPNTAEFRALTRPLKKD